jgi:hypothetical protein
MNKPIQAGDMCRVVSGLLGAQSPNIGLVVEVISRQGEHTKYGPIWLCKAEYAEIGQPGTRDVSGGRAHFAQDWLKKIEPPIQINTVIQTKELSL